MMRQAVFGALIMFNPGCAAQFAWDDTAPAGSGEAVVYLVGDGGKLEPGDRLLRHLAAEVAQAEHDVGSDGVVVLFLGDNIYPVGLRPVDHPKRADDVRHLDAQIDVLRNTDVRGIFVPGNHDWNKSKKGGFAAVTEQARYLDGRRATTGQRVEMLPGGGCPGPAIADIGDRVRIIVLDTEWWLRHYDKPVEGQCTPAADEDAFHDAIGAAIAEAGDREVIVAAHHPLRTAGEHGGRFSVWDHLVPLRNVRVLGVPLLIPLPGLGSLYPVARNNGVSDQDISGYRNREMRLALSDAFNDAATRARVFVAGHDHGLQVFCAPEDGGVEFALVSGAAGQEPSFIGRADGMVFAAAERGYMRLVFDGDRMRIAAFGFGKHGVTPARSWSREWVIPAAGEAAKDARGEPVCGGKP